HCYIQRSMLKGQLCHVLEVYFRVEIRRLEEIEARKGLDKNFPQSEAQYTILSTHLLKTAKGGQLSLALLLWRFFVLSRKLRLRSGHDQKTCPKNLVLAKASG